MNKELIDAAAQGFAKDAEKINRLATALKAIAFARDFHAEYGRYPYADEAKESPHFDPDQCFDDWAADVAQKALDACDIALDKASG